MILQNFPGEKERKKPYRQIFQPILDQIKLNGIDNLALHKQSI